MIQTPTHVAVVTQVPPCFMQVTSLRSSSIITTAHTPVPGFQSRSPLASHANWLALLTRSLHTPPVVEE